MANNGFDRDEIVVAGCCVDAVAGVLDIDGEVLRNGLTRFRGKTDDFGRRKLSVISKIGSTGFLLSSSARRSNGRTGLVVSSFNVE